MVCDFPLFMTIIAGLTVWQIENFLPVAVDECKMLFYNVNINNNYYDLMIHLLEIFIFLP